MGCTGLRDAKISRESFRLHSLDDACDSPRQQLLGVWEPATQHDSPVRRVRSLYLPTEDFSPPHHKASECFSPPGLIPVSIGRRHTSPDAVEDYSLQEPTSRRRQLKRMAAARRGDVNHGVRQALEACECANQDEFQTPKVAVEGSALSFRLRLIEEGWQDWTCVPCQLCSLPSQSRPWKSAALAVIISLLALVNFELLRAGAGSRTEGSSFVNTPFHLPSEIRTMSTATLFGLPRSNFGEQEQLQFREAVARAMEVPIDDVNIRKVARPAHQADWIAGMLRGIADEIQVEYEVAVGRHSDLPFRLHRQRHSDILRQELLDVGLKCKRLVSRHLIQNN